MLKIGKCSHRDSNICCPHLTFLSKIPSLTFSVFSWWMLRVCFFFFINGTYSTSWRFWWFTRNKHMGANSIQQAGIFFLSTLTHKNDNIILKCKFFKLCFLCSLSLNFSSGDICLLSKLIHRRVPKIIWHYLHRYNLTIFLQSLEQTFSQVTGVCASLSLEFFRWPGKFLGLNLFWAVKVFDS